jgi:hypothetical protein
MVLLALFLFACNNIEYVPVQYVTEVDTVTVYESLDPLLLSLLPSGVGGGTSIDSTLVTDTANYIYFSRRVYGTDIERVSLVLSYIGIGYDIYMDSELRVVSIPDTIKTPPNITCYYLEPSFRALVSFSSGILDTITFSNFLYSDYSSVWYNNNHITICF